MCSRGSNSSSNRSTKLAAKEQHLWELTETRAALVQKRRNMFGNTVICFLHIKDNGQTLISQAAWIRRRTCSLMCACSKTLEKYKPNMGKCSLILSTNRRMIQTDIIKSNYPNEEQPVLCTSRRCRAPHSARISPALKLIQSLLLRIRSTRLTDRYYERSISCIYPPLD
jgi:hypothetical protein